MVHHIKSCFTVSERVDELQVEVCMLEHLVEQQVLQHTYTTVLIR